MGQHVRNLSTEQFFFGRAPKKKEENERESMSKNLTWLTGLCGFCIGTGLHRNVVLWSIGCYCIKKVTTVPLYH